MLTGGSYSRSSDAIVPFRGFPEGKTRLAALLSADQRVQLNRAMLHDVCTALAGAALISSVTILSCDDSAALEAQDLGVRFIQQPSSILGLNSAINHIQDMYKDSSALLIIPADLPLITSSEIDRLVRAGSTNTRMVAIAPSFDGGTNGLMLKPPTIILTDYGFGSADKHQAAARNVRAPISIVRSLQWSLDVDSPEHLTTIMESNIDESIASDSQTLHCLSEMDFSGITS